MSWILVVFMACIDTEPGQLCAGFKPYVGASEFSTLELCEKAAAQAKYELVISERYFVGTECVPFKIPGMEKVS